MSTAEDVSSLKRTDYGSAHPGVHFLGGGPFTKRTSRSAFVAVINATRQRFFEGRRRRTDVEADGPMFRVVRGRRDVSSLRRPYAESAPYTTAKSDS